MDDLISRREAIDAMTNTLWHYPGECYRNLNKYEFAKGLAELGLKSVPSAQHEIIHCKECEYGVQDEDERWYCRGFGCQVGEEDGSGFCADAERRTDE